MTLSAKDVAEIARLLDESSFDELHLECEGLKLSLRRHGAPPAEAAAPLVPVPAPAARPAAVAPTATLVPGPEADDPTLATVTAPLLGTFYRAPKPGAAPYVEVGSQVEADTIVGIIEVMKLMNTVRASVRGTVVAILPADGALVEYGQALLQVRRDGAS